MKPEPTDEVLEQVLTLAGGSRLVMSREGDVYDASIQTWQTECGVTSSDPSDALRRLLRKLKARIAKAKRAVEKS